VRVADAILLLAPVTHVEAWTTEDHVEIHAVDADRRVVLDAEIDVFLNAEAEVSRRREVVLAQFVLAHLQAALQDLFRLGTAHRAVHRDLLVPPDAERAHGVARLREDGRLTGELFQHFRGARQAIARLADADVETELLDADVAHHVRRFAVDVFRHFRLGSTKRSATEHRKKTDDEGGGCKNRPRYGRKTPPLLQTGKALHS